MKVDDSWKKIFEEEYRKDYYKKLMFMLKKEEQNNKIIYPKKEDWFNSFCVNIDKVKVIIIGQDPYHGENQANGFAFSVKKNIKVPPSLKNIYKEIEREFGCNMDYKNGDLLPWVEQGVLLLNSVLTVNKSSPGSHKNYGWERFTDEIIFRISHDFSEKVFMLWGAYAIEKKKIIDEKKNLILTSSHPSPFSFYKGFLGNNHFIEANKYLEKNNKEPISWVI